MNATSALTLHSLTLPAHNVNTQFFGWIPAFAGMTGCVQANFTTPASSVTLFAPLDGLRLGGNIVTVGLPKGAAQKHRPQ